MIGGLLSLALLLATQARADPYPPRAELTPEALKAQIADVMADLSALRVAYRSYSYEAGRVPAGAYFHKEILAAAPCWFALESGHGDAGLDWRDDPYRQAAYVTETTVRTETFISRSFTEGPWAASAALPGTLRNEFFFVTSGLWPLTQRPPPGADAGILVLREIANSPSHGQVRAEQELVDGRLCHVLEWPGRDALWLDVERGCALLRRDLLDPADGSLALRFLLGGHEPAASGPWLPRWIERLEFPTSDPDEAAARRVRIEILDIGSEPISTASFEPAHPPGSVRNDRQADGFVPTQVVPGGLDLLDQQIEWMRRVHPRRDGNRRAGTALPPWPLALVLAWIACVEILRRRRSRAGSGH